MEEQTKEEKEYLVTYADGLRLSIKTQELDLQRMEDNVYFPVYITAMTQLEPSRNQQVKHCYTDCIMAMTMADTSVKGVDTTVYKPIEEVTVVPTKWETEGRTKVQAWGQTLKALQELSTDKTAIERRNEQLTDKGLYGPYQDRKGKR